MDIGRGSYKICRQYFFAGGVISEAVAQGFFGTLGS